MTDRPKHYDKDDEFKTMPCREGQDSTDKPCAVNGDTKHYCVIDGNTFLPCIGSTKDGPPCFTDDKGPGQGDENYTKYICKEKSETKIPCKGGTVDTKIDGIPDKPWWGHMANTKPCSNDSSTQHECQFDNTAFACRHKKDEEHNTEIRCQTGSNTQEFCKYKNTKCKSDDNDQLTKECKGSGTEYCSWGTCWKSETSDFPKDTKLAVAANLGCPPLSPLELDATDPNTPDALAILHAELRDALAQVEIRQREVNERLRPAAGADVSDLERSLEAALTELRAKNRTPESGYREPTE